jgi:hypothetical protein
VETRRHLPSPARDGIMMISPLRVGVVRDALSVETHNGASQQTVTYYKPVIILTIFMIFFLQIKERTFIFAIEKSLLANSHPLKDEQH